jgi:hypothetical protein
MMTEERIAEIEMHIKRIESAGMTNSVKALTGCLDEIRRLQEFERDAMRYRQLKKDAHGYSDRLIWYLQGDCTQNAVVRLDQTLDARISKALQAEGEQT